MPTQPDESLTPGPSQSSEVALWRGVLERAQLDLKGSSLSDGKDGAAANEVRAWVNTRDFDRCCLNANVDPDKTRAVFQELIERTANDEET